MKQRIVDAVLVLAGLAFTGLGLKGHWSTLPWPVALAAGVAGSAALWTRRRWPQVAAVVGAAAYAVSGNPLPLGAGLYSGATYLPRRHGWWLALVGWAGIAGMFWVEEGHLSASDALYAAPAAAGLIGVGQYTATHRALLASKDAERLLSQEQARSAERTRIAREMHDVLAHKVSLIALHAGALELSAATGDKAKIEQGAALIRVTAREALQELRTVLGVLKAPAEPFADLAALVRSSTEAGQQVDLADDAGQLPPRTARVVYRIAQEGLTNARKHAPGAPASVSVHRDDEDTVTVTVQNSATSRQPLDLPGSGAGLVGLAERIRLVGGTLDSGPVDAGGWRLRAVVPWLDDAR